MVVFPTSTSTSTTTHHNHSDSGTDSNWLPLHIASRIGDYQSLEKSIKNGAKVNLPDVFGRTALHYAAENCAKCVEVLMGAKADHSMTDANNATPLHWAAYKGKEDCVKVLLSNGINVNAQNITGETALFYAARKSQLQIVRLLLDHNADPMLLHSKGYTVANQTLSFMSVELNEQSDVEVLGLLSESSSRLPASITHQSLQDGLELPYVQRVCRYREELASKVCEDGSCNTHKDCKLYRAVRTLRGELFSLKHLSRCVIRKALGKSFLPDTTMKLNIPKILKDYILLRYG